MQHIGSAYRQTHTFAQQCREWYSVIIISGSLFWIFSFSLLACWIIYPLAGHPTQPRLILCEMASSSIRQQQRTFALHGAFQFNITCSTKTPTGTWWTDFNSNSSSTTMQISDNKYAQYHTDTVKPIFFLLLAFYVSIPQAYFIAHWFSMFCVFVCINIFRCVVYMHDDEYTTSKYIRWSEHN